MKPTGFIGAFDDLNTKTPGDKASFCFWDYYVKTRWFSLINNIRGFRIE